MPNASEGNITSSLFLDFIFLTRASLAAPIPLFFHVWTKSPKLGKATFVNLVVANIVWSAIIPVNKASFFIVYSIWWRPKYPSTPCFTNLICLLASSFIDSLEIDESPPALFCAWRTSSLISWKTLWSPCPFAPNTLANSTTGTVLFIRLCKVNIGSFTK